MENDFKIEIPIDFTGLDVSGKSERGAEEIVKGQDKLGTILGKIAIGVGITALIWKGLEPLLTPLLKLLTMIALVLFLPLMPYIKQIAQKLAETAKAVKEGQKGDSPMAEFTGGLGAFIGDNYWLIAGGIIAGGIIAALSGPALLGALTLALGTAIVFNSIDENDMMSKLGAAGLIGLAAGIATAILGGGPVLSTLVGILSFGLAMEFLPFEKISIDDIKKALMGAALAAVVVGGLAALFFGAPGFIIAGTITFMLSLVFDLSRGKNNFDKIQSEYFEKYQNDAMKMSGTIDLSDQELARKFYGIPELPKVDLESIREDISKTETKWITLDGKIGTSILNLNQSLAGDRNSLGFYIAGEQKGSYPLVYSLIQAENEWVNMANVSNSQINSIIGNLNRIPRTIVTTHIIRTIKQ
jgi:hypothetical protein